MSIYLPLLVAAPILGAGLLIMFPRIKALRYALITGIPAGTGGFAIALIIHHRTTPVIATQIGSWPVGVAIPFASDSFSALMLAGTSLCIVACMGLAIATGAANERYFAPLSLVLGAGVAGALVTADLFNLFVFIELMFLPSCGLIIMGKGIKHLGAARLYVTINLLTSSLFVIGVGLIYGLTGNVNLAKLAGAAQDSQLVSTAAAVVLIALCIKAAVFPVHGWLPRTYSGASPVVTALFSALHTKVAVYAIYRIYAVIFGETLQYQNIILIFLGITMIVGGLGALGENHMRSVLAYSTVSQIGFILLGIAFFSELALTAGIFYLVHHMVVKTGLILTTSSLEETYGSGKFEKLSDMARKEPLVATVFFIGSLSLAGIPPFSGFIAKLSMVGIAVENNVVIIIICMLVSSLLTLMAMLSIWRHVFWEHTLAHDYALVDSGNVLTETKTRVGIAFLLPGLILIASSVIFGIGAGVILDIAHDGAESLVNIGPYIEAVTTP